MNIRAQLAVASCYAGLHRVERRGSYYVGTSVPVRAAAADRRPYPMAALMRPRGSRVAFARDPQTLLVLRVDSNQMTLVQVDLQSGLQRTLYELPSDFIVRHFDVIPDGQEIVLARIEDNSDVALIERAL